MSQSNTNGNFYSNARMSGSNGWANGSVSGNYQSTTNATIYSDELRQQAQRRVAQDANYRDAEIKTEYQNWEYGLNNFYFDSTTIFPGSFYSANFQIEVPKEIEKDLQYLLFTYKVGNEKHTFSFYCSEVKKKWYRFGF